jgi:hypothetical protein
MNVREIAPEVDVGALLAGAQFVDAFRLEAEGLSIDARHAAERMLGRAPRWVDTLLKLRNLLVAPFGLKTSGASESEPHPMIGIFPILSETPGRLVAGFNDSHLDFRVVVDVATAAATQRVTATTLVLTHNLLGRVYLAIILPFHRLIVRTMLRQVAA